MQFTPYGDAKRSRFTEHQEAINVKRMIERGYGRMDAELRSQFERPILSVSIVEGVKLDRLREIHGVKEVKPCPTT